MNDLATIRRAYRYVVAYERRILDAFARIDEVIRGAGFVRETPQRWWTMYSTFPSRDWPSNRWAWDHVPMYAARFQWNAGDENAAGTRYVLVDHIADTAFEAARLGNARLEPEPLSGLGQPETARTILRWHLVELLGSVPAAVWDDDWHKFFSKHFGLTMSALLPTTGLSEPIRREQGAVRLTSWCLDLATVEDADGLELGFLEPLRTALMRASEAAETSPSTPRP